jgi:DNA-binding MarR family transcriptional regulator
MGMPVDFELPEADPTADEPTRLATDAWGRVANLFLSQQDRREEIAAELGLHFSDMISLFHLSPDEGVSQRDLAGHWACDPSWVTNRIDRLEQEELVERRVSPTDRRVKEVWLTAEGRRVRSRGMTAFARPPAALADLSIGDLRSLARILAKVDPGRGCSSRLP